MEQLLDVFATGTCLNLVLEYLDTDLEAVIKDRTLVFHCQDVKSWMAMAFRGLEFCHRNGILHRVSTPFVKPLALLYTNASSLDIGSETK